MKTSPAGMPPEIILNTYGKNEDAGKKQRTARKREVRCFVCMLFNSRMSEGNQAFAL